MIEKNIQFDEKALAWLESLQEKMGLSINDAIDSMVMYINSAKVRRIEFQEYYSSL